MVIEHGYLVERYLPDASIEPSKRARPRSGDPLPLVGVRARGGQLLLHGALGRENASRQRGSRVPLRPLFAAVLPG